MKIPDLFALLLGLSMMATHADPKAPVYHLTSVSWVVATREKLHTDNLYVTLIGRVVKKEGDDAIWFSDGTGSVRLDVGKFELPVGPKLVLGGRIDQPFLGIGDLEVDVQQWRYVKNP